MALRIPYLNEFRSWTEVSAQLTRGGLGVSVLLHPYTQTSNTVKPCDFWSLCWQWPAWVRLSRSCSGCKSLTSAAGCAVVLYVSPSFSVSEESRRGRVSGSAVMILLQLLLLLPFQAALSSHTAQPGQSRQTAVFVWAPGKRWKYGRGSSCNVGSNCPSCFGFYK